MLVFSSISLFSIAMGGVNTAPLRRDKGLSLSFFASHKISLPTNLGMGFC